MHRRPLGGCSVAKVHRKRYRPRSRPLSGVGGSSSTTVASPTIPPRTSTTSPSARPACCNPRANATAAMCGATCRHTALRLLCDPPCRRVRVVARSNISPKRSPPASVCPVRSLIYVNHAGSPRRASRPADFPSSAHETCSRDRLSARLDVEDVKIIAERVGTL